MSQPDHTTNSQFDHTLKIVLIGDSGVGKSCLIYRYTDDVFDHNTTTTVGIDFNIKVLYMKDKKIKLQIWDTAGQERFNTFIPLFSRGAQVCLICIENASVANIEKWKKILDKDAPPIIYIIVMKVDRENFSRKEFENIEKYAEECNHKIFYSSSATGEGVREIFYDIAHSVQNLKKNQHNNVITFNEKVVSDKRCCY